MAEYVPPLRDIRFLLAHVVGLDELAKLEGFGHADAESVFGVLEEFGRLMSEVWSPTNPVGDSVGSSLVDGQVRTPPGFAEAYARYVEAGWPAVPFDPAYDGGGFPWLVGIVLQEMLNSANMALAMAPLLTQGAIDALLHHGTEEQRERYLKKMVTGEWTGTMNLTEADAGSDVGALRTRAVRQDDGTYRISGQKVFITFGDHDLADNIVHLVLARPQGEGIENHPGTKGLSLFAVPKFHVDMATGELGERNGAFVTGLEHKMGLKVSTTCELSFGQNGIPAVGTLVGNVHNGIAQMFHVIEYARMMVGTKAIATLSTGYLNALEYAKQRVQGADLTRNTDKTAARVTIIHHPDVRRILMRQKAYAEGLRAVYFYAAEQQELIEVGAADDVDSAQTLLARKVNDLLLPVVKGVGSERAYENLALSLQTLGGSGYTQDYPIEQYIRDAKIDTLYEGTTAIQAQDFFFRKIVRDDGTALAAVCGEISSLVDKAGPPASDGRLKNEIALLATALGDVQAMVGVLVGYTVASATDPGSVYKVGEHAVSLLMSVGDLLIGYLLLRQAVVAQAALDSGEAPMPGSDRDFYTGKLAVASWFSRNVLPELSARRAIIEAADTSLMQVPEAAF